MKKDKQTIYKVIINPKVQYSIWKSRFTAPTGWRDEGRSGSKKACLDYISKVSGIEAENLQSKMEALMKENGIE